MKVLNQLCPRCKSKLIRVGNINRIVGCPKCGWEAKKLNKMIKILK